MGGTFLEENSLGSAVSGQGYASEALLTNIGAANTITAGSNYDTQYRYNAIFGRLNYTLLDKYIVNLTARRDGSSRFGTGNQYANFGAIGLAWIFSKEKWFNNSSFLSFGKIRGSYGTTGNDQIGDYQYLDSYTSYVSYWNGIGTF